MIDCWNWIFRFFGKKDNSSNSIDDVSVMGKEEKRVDIPPPLLLTIHELYVDGQSFYNLVDNRCRTTHLPVLNNKQVLGSSYGWLVLIDFSEGGDCCLWNPKTMEMIELPYMQYFPLPYNRCILSSSPTTTTINHDDQDNCFVVFEQFDSLYQTVCRISDGSVFQVNYEELGYCIIAMASFQGSIYGVAGQPGLKYKYEFVSVHLVGDTLETRPLLIDGGENHHWALPDHQLIRSWVECNTYYLIESPCGNELLLVTLMLLNEYHDCGQHFRIFRVDVSRRVCQEIENLDGRTIFIGFYGNGFCCYSEESFNGRSIKPNSIYYTDDKGVAIHVYDLDDRSTTTLFPFSDFDFDTNWSTSFWVDLPHNILDYSGLAT